MTSLTQSGAIGCGHPCKTDFLSSRWTIAIINKALGDQAKYVASLLHPDFVRNVVNVKEDWTARFTVETTFRSHRQRLNNLRKVSNAQQSQAKKIKYLSTQHILSTTISQDFQQLLDPVRASSFLLTSIPFAKTSMKAAHCFLLSLFSAGTLCDRQKMMTTCKRRCQQAHRKRANQTRVMVGMDHRAPLAT